MESANKHQQKQTRGINNELLRCLRVSVAPRPFWELGGLPAEPRRVSGAPWEVPGELRGGSLGHPVGVLGAALGDFGCDLGEQASTKWRGSIRLTVLDPKRVPKWSPRGGFLGVKINPKSHRFFNAILGAILGVPGHSPRLKSCIFVGELFKIEGLPF